MIRGQTTIIIMCVIRLINLLWPLANYSLSPGCQAERGRERGARRLHHGDSLACAIKCICICMACEKCSRGTVTKPAAAAAASWCQCLGATDFRSALLRCSRRSSLPRLAYEAALIGAISSRRSWESVPRRAIVRKVC